MERSTPLLSKETPLLLKGVLRLGIPPALRCAVWLSNVIQTVHPQQPPQYWYEYRTLAKASALEGAYELVLGQVLGGVTARTTGTTTNNNIIINNSDCTNDDTTGGLVQETTPPPPPIGIADSTLSRRQREEQQQQMWRDIPGPYYQSGEPPELEGTTPSGRVAQKRVLLALERLLGMEYAPAVPMLCQVLLTAQSEAYAFCTLREMAHQPTWYFAVTPIEQQAMYRAYADVLHKLHPQTAEYLQDRGVLDDLQPVFAHFFVPYMPLDYVWRIVDLYTLEGYKVLFRFAVSLMVLFKKYTSEQLLTISNAKEWWLAFREWTHNPRLFPFELVVRKAYGVHGHGIRRQMRFPRRNILQCIIRMEEERLLELQYREQELRPLHIDITPSSTVSGSMSPRPTQALGVAPSRLWNADASPAIPVLVTSMSTRWLLAEWMPLPLRLTNLELLYSTNHHGRSLEMFYHCVQRARQTLVLCEVLTPIGSQSSRDSDPAATAESTATRTVVGMYAPHAWRPSPQVYGDGSCFLFRLQPNPHCWKWKPQTDIHVLDCTSFEEGESSQHSNTNTTNNSSSDGGSNPHPSTNAVALLEQFMVSTARYISMGGNPDGSAGLRLNEDFTMGESSPAVGFHNEPLHGGPGSVFDVGLVEVYGFVREMDGRPV